MAKILVVEDDDTMRDMLRFNLDRAGHNALGAGDGNAGLRLCLSEKPDLVLLDLMLPEVDGLTLCRDIRTVDPSVPIIMVTALGGEEDRLEGFSAGADDFVTKPFSMEELLARIKANLRRGRQPRGERTEGRLIYGDLEIDPANYVTKINSEEVHLRSKEFQLLTLLASSPGRLFSRPEIADKVWGYDFLGDSRTIDVHIKNLRRKIEGPSSHLFIETVRGAGYRFKLRPKPAPKSSSK